MQDPQSVAIVDDDEHVRKALERVFRSAQFVVESFPNAESFLTGYIPKNEGCIILDLRMPFVGGLEILEQLKVRGVSVPVIIYSGNADVPVAVRAMQAGAFIVLEKPVSNELLIDHVRTAITATRKQRAQRKRSAIAGIKLRLLTEREYETARHVAEGLSAPEIATCLGISQRTVEAHRLNLFRKLEIRSSAELARLFVLAELEGD